MMMIILAGTGVLLFLIGRFTLQACDGKSPRWVMVLGAVVLYAIIGNVVASGLDAFMTPTPVRPGDLASLEAAERELLLKWAISAATGFWLTLKSVNALASR